MPLEETKMSQNNEKDIAVLATDIKYLRSAMERIEKRFDLMNDHYVKKEEFETLKGGLHNHLLDYSVFKTQIKTWGSAAILVSAVVQFIIAKYF